MTDLSDVPCETLKIEYIEPKFIDMAWRDGASVLEEVCNLVDEVKIDQLKLILMRGEKHLVCLRSGKQIMGWGVFEVYNLPNFRVFHISQLHAPHVLSKNYMEPLKNLALSFGCLRIRVAAHEAQARLYKSIGFKPIYTNLELKL